MPNSNTTVVEGLMHEVRQLKKDVADLNRLLRDIGWGQGEIDTAAVIAEENEKLVAALRNLVEQAKYLTPCGDDLRYDCCDASIEKGHASHCPYAAAIAEAERLLKEN